MTQVAFASPAERSGPYLDFSDGSIPFGHELVTTKSDFERHEALQNLQWAIQKLHDSDAPADYKTEVGINFRHDADTQPSTDGFYSAAYPEGLVAWLATAAPSDFELYCEYNLDRFSDHQKRLRDVQGYLQDDASHRITLLVAQGILPKISNVFMQNVLNTVELRPMDSISAGGTGFDAYFMNELLPYKAISNLFVNRPAFRGISAELTAAVLHEDLHALGAIHDAGFYTGLVKVDPTQRDFGWLEEAFVTRIEGMSYANEQLDLSAKPYAHEQLLLTLLAEQGSHPISTQELGAAFIEGRDNPVLRSKLFDKRDANYRHILGDKGSKGLLEFGRLYASLWQNSIQKQLFLDTVVRTMMRIVTGVDDEHDIQRASAFSVSGFVELSAAKEHIN